MVSNVNAFDCSEGCCVEAVFLFIVSLMGCCGCEVCLSFVIQIVFKMMHVRLINCNLKDETVKINLTFILLKGELK